MITLTFFFWLQFEPVMTPHSITLVHHILVYACGNASVLPSGISDCCGANPDFFSCALRCLWAGLLEERWVCRSHSLPHFLLWTAAPLLAACSVGPHSPAGPNKLGKFPHTVPTLFLLHRVMPAISTELSVHCIPASNKFCMSHTKAFTLTFW